MAIIRAVGGERRSAVVRTEFTDAEIKRQSIRNLDQVFDTISKGKGNANANKVRDDLADLAEALKPLTKVI